MSNFIYGFLGDAFSFNNPSLPDVETVSDAVKVLYGEITYLARDLRSAGIKDINIKYVPAETSPFNVVNDTHHIYLYRTDKVFLHTRSYRAFNIRVNDPEELGATQRIDTALFHQTFDSGLGNSLEYSADYKPVLSFETSLDSLTDEVIAALEQNIEMILTPSEQIIWRNHLKYIDYLRQNPPKNSSV